MGRKTNMFNLIKRINKDAEGEEDFKTGLIGESIIIASYKQMEIEKLEKIRFIINKIIKKKKVLKMIEKLPDNEQQN